MNLGSRRGWRTDRGHGSGVLVIVFACRPPRRRCCCCSVHCRWSLGCLGIAEDSFVSVRLPCSGSWPATEGQVALQHDEDDPEVIPQSPERHHGATLLILFSSSTISLDSRSWMLTADVGGDTTRVFITPEISLLVPLIPCG